MKFLLTKSKALSKKVFESWNTLETRMEKKLVFEALNCGVEFTSGKIKLKVSYILQKKREIEER